jgi:dsDNA-specific endonuclease/ATPase MutS2
MEKLKGNYIMAISKTVLNAISKMSQEDLIDLNRIVVDAANKKIRESRNEVKSKFTVGDRVSFVTKRGQRVEGSVGKINKVNIKVNSNGAIWTVSPHFLKKV